MIEYYNETIDDYWKGSFSDHKENANVSRLTVSGMAHHVAAEAFRTEAINQLPYGYLVANGAIHMHDLDVPFCTPYCAGHDIRTILGTGMGVEPGVTSLPPKHLDTAINMIESFLQCCQNEAAGAQALSDVDLWLAPFVYTDNLSYDEVKQHIQHLFFSLGVESRSAFQTPFVNFSFAYKVPNSMKDEPCTIAGEFVPTSDGTDYVTYGDLQPCVDMINKAFFEMYMEGDGVGRGFTFPIPTYSMTEDSPLFAEPENWSENDRLFWEMACKTGMPYYSNHWGTGIDPNTVRSMCCRLRLDLDEIRSVFGARGIWDIPSKTGSIAAATINLHRCAIEAGGDVEVYLDTLERRVQIAAEMLTTRLKHVLIAFGTSDDMMDTYVALGMSLEDIESARGRTLLPYMKKFVGSLRSFFLTIGVVGGWEAYIDICKKSGIILTFEQFATMSITTVRKTMSELPEETGWELWNFEQTPCEGASHKLAKLDRRYDPCCTVSGEGDGIYLTNSFHLPPNHNKSLADETAYREKIDSWFTGGTLFNIERHDHASPEALMRRIRTLCKETKIPYIADTPVRAFCPNGCEEFIGVFENDQCPECGAPLEYMTRVVGYYRYVSNFNAGKKQEFIDRKKHSITEDVTKNDQTEEKKHVSN